MLTPLVATGLGVAILTMLGDPARHAGLVVGVVVAWGLLVVLGPGPDVGRPALVALAALAVRAPLLTLAPTLSDDVWRYVWEGGVWRAGFNPFVYAPNDPILTTLRDDVWTHVNHRDVPSIYPPLAQALFVALADGGVWAWRALSAGCDVGTAYLLARVRPRAGWVWALLPLPALESAVSGHLEGIGVLLMVGAITTRQGVWAWLGAMVKLLPGVLLVLEPRRRWLGWLALTLVVSAPIVATHGFETYRSTWSFNGSLFPLLEWGVGSRARTIAQGLGLAIVLATLVRSRDPARIALWTTGAFVLLSPTVHPWYGLWPLAAGLVHRSTAWTLLAALLPLAYLVLSTRDPMSGGWTEAPSTRWFLYLPFYAVGAWELLRNATRAGPTSVS